jgi:hypothetical protein
MKRIIGLLSVTAAIASLPVSGASAYVDTTSPVSSVHTTNGQFGSPANSFDIQMASNPGFGDAVPNGSASFSGTDARGLHQWVGFGVCLHVDPVGHDATILVDIYDTTGEPATLAGALIHVTDTESAGSESGVGDRMNVTNLSVNQYNRQYALGCAATPTGKTAIAGGDITIVKGA